MEGSKNLQLELFELQVAIRESTEALLKEKQAAFVEADMDEAFKYLTYQFRYAPIQPIETVLKMTLGAKK